MSIAKKLMVAVLLVSSSAFGQGDREKAQKAVIKGAKNECVKNVASFSKKTAIACCLCAISSYCCGCTTIATSEAIVAAGAYIASEKLITKQPK